MRGQGVRDDIYDQSARIGGEGWWWCVCVCVCDMDMYVDIMCVCVELNDQRDTVHGDK